MSPSPDNNKLVGKARSIPQCPPILPPPLPPLSIPPKFPFFHSSQHDFISFHSPNLISLWSGQSESTSTRVSSTCFCLGPVRVSLWSCTFQSWIELMVALWRGRWLWSDPAKDWFGLKWRKGEKITSMDVHDQSTFFTIWLLLRAPACYFITSFFFLRT